MATPKKGHCPTILSWGSAPFVKHESGNRVTFYSNDMLLEIKLSDDIIALERIRIVSTTYPFQVEHQFSQKGGNASSEFSSSRLLSFQQFMSRVERKEGVPPPRKCIIFGASHHSIQTGLVERFKPELIAHGFLTNESLRKRKRVTWGDDETQGAINQKYGGWGLISTFVIPNREELRALMTMQEEKEEEDDAMYFLESEDEDEEEEEELRPYKRSRLFHDDDQAEQEEFILSHPDFTLAHLSSPAFSNVSILESSNGHDDMYENQTSLNGGDIGKDNLNRVELEDASSEEEDSEEDSKNSPNKESSPTAEDQENSVVEEEILCEGRIVEEGMESNSLDGSFSICPSQQQTGVKTLDSPCRASPPAVVLGENVERLEPSGLVTSSALPLAPVPSSCLADEIKEFDQWLLDHDFVI
jgi:hypothetical protein